MFLFQFFFSRWPKVSIYGALGASAQCFEMIFEGASLFSYICVLTRNYIQFRVAKINLVQMFHTLTGKSFSEALILASVNPRYDKRLFIEFPEKYKFRTCCVQILFFVFVLTCKTIFVHNMLWTCIFLGIQWTISHHIVGYSP